MQCAGAHRTQRGAARERVSDGRLLGSAHPAIPRGQTLQLQVARESHRTGLAIGRTEQIAAVQTPEARHNDLLPVQSARDGRLDNQHVPPGGTLSAATGPAALCRRRGARRDRPRGILAAHAAESDARAARDRDGRLRESRGAGRGGGGGGSGRDIRLVRREPRRTAQLQARGLHRHLDFSNWALDPAKTNSGILGVFEYGLLNSDI